MLLIDEKEIASQEPRMIKLSFLRSDRSEEGDGYPGPDPAGGPTCLKLADSAGMSVELAWLLPPDLLRG
jgi:hypothetical protein